MLGWFFERHEQRVERLIGQHVNFIDDVDLESRTAGPHGHIGAQLPNLFNPTVTGTVDLDHIHVFAGFDRGGIRLVGFVQSFGENPSRRCLADSASTREQVSVSNSA